MKVKYFSEFEFAVTELLCQYEHGSMSDFSPEPWLQHAIRGNSPVHVARTWLLLKKAAFERQHIKCWPLVLL